MKNTKPYLRTLSFKTTYLVFKNMIINSFLYSHSGISVFIGICKIWHPFSRPKYEENQNTHLDSLQLTLKRRLSLKKNINTNTFKNFFSEK